MRVTEEDPDRSWYAEGVHRVRDGIHRLPLPLPGDGLRAVNAYALTADDTITLIDPGIHGAGSLDALHAGLTALGAGLPDVTQVLVTHMHADHYSQAVGLRRRHGMPVWLGAHERATIEALRTTDIGWKPQLRLLERYGASELAREMEREPTDPEMASLLSQSPDRWVADAELLDVAGGPLTAVHTPGHTRGHVVFRDAERGVLFAGDHVLPTITPSLGLEAAIADRPLADYLRSLLAVRAMPDAQLLPAHGRVTDSVHERIDELLDHHDVRLAAARTAVEGGATTALEVAERLPWTRKGRRYEELDRFNRMLAVLETGFHLDLLVDRGEIDIALVERERRYASR